MTTALVYCVTDISEDVVNDFLKVSPKAGANWKIVQSTADPQDGEQKTIESPIDSKLKGYTMDELQKHHQARIPKPYGRLTHNNFGILDERSTKDRTVELRSLISTWPQELLETADPDPEAKITYWRGWRVRFDDAGLALVDLAQRQDLYVTAYDKPEYFDANGVFKVPE